MAKVGDRFRPGTSAPVAGFYRSTKSGQAIAIAKGNTLPATPAAGEAWKLIQIRPR